MALNFPITFSLAPLATGLALSGDDYAQAIVANLQATISGNFLTGQIGGNAPTQDVGPWANNGQWYFWDPSIGAYVQQSFASFTLPSGLIFPYTSITAPSGFLLCNGQAVSRTTFGNLFAICSTSFGVGDGSTTFNVPNLAGRSPIGAGVSGLGNVYTIGQKFGEEKHVIVGTEVGAHNHTQTAHAHPGSTGVEAAHTHTVSGTTGTVFGVQAGGSTFFLPGTVTTSAQSNSAVTVTVAAQAAVNVATPAAVGHNTVHPVQGVAFIVKT